MIKKCQECIVRASCSKKYYEKTLCSEAFEEAVSTIENLERKIKEISDCHGLSIYFFEQKTKGKDPIDISSYLDSGFTI